MPHFSDLSISETFIEQIPINSHQVCQHSSFYWFKLIRLVEMIRSGSVFVFVGCKLVSSANKFLFNQIASLLPDPRCRKPGEALRSGNLLRLNAPRCSWSILRRRRSHTEGKVTSSSLKVTEDHQSQTPDASGDKNLRRDWSLWFLNASPRQQPDQKQS